MRWTRIGIVILTMFGTILAQQGYDYPKPNTPFPGSSPTGNLPTSPSSGGSQPGRPGALPRPTGSQRPGGYQNQPSRDESPSGRPTEDQRPTEGQEPSNGQRPSGYPGQQPSGQPAFGGPQGFTGPSRPSTGFQGSGRPSAGGQQGYNYPTPQKPFPGSFPPSGGSSPTTSTSGGQPGYPNSQGSSDGYQTSQPGPSGFGSQRPTPQQNNGDYKKQQRPDGYPGAASPTGPQFPSVRPSGAQQAGGQPTAQFPTTGRVGGSTQRQQGGYPGNQPQFPQSPSGYPGSERGGTDSSEQGYPGAGRPEGTQFTPGIPSTGTGRPQSPSGSSETSSRPSTGYPSSTGPTGVQGYPGDQSSGGVGRPQGQQFPISSFPSSGTTAPGVSGLERPQGSQFPSRRPQTGGIPSQQAPGAFPQRPSSDYLPPKQGSDRFSTPDKRPQFPTGARPVGGGREPVGPTGQSGQSQYQPGANQGGQQQAPSIDNNRPSGSFQSPGYSTSDRPGSSQFPATSDGTLRPGQTSDGDASRPGFQGYEPSRPNFPTSPSRPQTSQSGFPGQTSGTDGTRPGSQDYGTTRPNFPGPSRPQTTQPGSFPGQTSGTDAAQPGSQDYGTSTPNFQGSSRPQPSQFGDFPGNQEGTGDDQYEAGDYSAIPGEPDVDYPILSSVPETSFKCEEQQFPGYYADVETRCQAFHVCANDKKYDFLCPNGTIFHQEYLVCVWWNQFDCNTAQSLYGINENIYDFSITGIQQTGGIPVPGSDFPLPQGPGGSSITPSQPGAQRPGGYPSNLPGPGGDSGEKAQQPGTIGGQTSLGGGSQVPSGYPSSGSGGYGSGKPQEPFSPSSGRPGFQTSDDDTQGTRGPVGYPTNRPQEPTFPSGKPTTGFPSQQTLEGPNQLPGTQDQGQRPGGYPGARPQVPGFQPAVGRPQTPGFQPQTTKFPLQPSVSTQSQGPAGYPSGRPQGPSFSPGTGRPGFGTQGPGSSSQPTTGEGQFPGSGSQSQRPAGYPSGPSFPSGTDRPQGPGFSSQSTTEGGNTQPQRPGGYPSGRPQGPGLQSRPQSPGFGNQAPGGRPQGPDFSSEADRPQDSGVGTQRYPDARPQTPGAGGSQTPSSRPGGYPSGSRQDTKPQVQGSFPESSGTQTGGYPSQSFAPGSQGSVGRPGTPFPGSPKPHQPTRDYLPPVSRK